MADDRTEPGPSGEEPSDHRSSWKALIIALAPIPIALLITWALGAPLPWQSRLAPSAPVPGPVEGHGHR